MGRVSLTEDYDDRSVIAKLNEMDKRVTENTTVVTAAEASAKASAQAAQETADRFAGSVGAVVQNANAQINASKAQVDQAKAEVDETVTTVAQAVQTANQASASAQQSATTVEGYDARLTTAEGDIDTLQTADTKNVKLEGNQTITGTKTFTVTRTKNSLETKADIPPQQRQTQPVQVVDRNDEQVMFNQLLTNTNGTRQYRTNLFAVNGTRVVVENIFLNADGTGYSTCVNPSADAPSSATVNKAYVESTDGVTNNLVHKTANETIRNIKTFTDGIMAYPSGWHRILGNQSAGEYVHFATYNGSYGWNALLEFMSSSNNGCEYGLLGLSNGGDTEPNANNAVWFVRGCGEAPNKILFQKNLYICHNAGSNEWHLVMYKHDNYGNVTYHVKMENGYGDNAAPESRIIAVTPTAVNFDSYTHKYRVSDAVVGSE